MGLSEDAEPPRRLNKTQCSEHNGRFNLELHDCLLPGIHQPVLLQEAEVTSTVERKRDTLTHQKSSGDQRADTGLLALCSLRHANRQCKATTLYVVDSRRRSMRPRMWSTMTISTPLATAAFQPDSPTRERYAGPAYATSASSTSAQASAAATLRRLNRNGFMSRYAQAAASAIRNPGMNRMRSTMAV